MQPGQHSKNDLAPDHVLAQPWMEVASLHLEIA